MQIGDLAAASSTSVESIRYYEREGLLPAPARTQGNYRTYDAAHVQRLQFIRRCRALDMTLDEVRALLRFIDTPQDDCAGVNALLDEHLGHVRHRIAELRPYLYTPEGQEIAAQNHYRPTDPKVAARYDKQFAKVKLFTIDEVFGGWAKAQKTHFADGGVFDQIYTRNR